MCTVMIIDDRYTVQNWLLKCIEKSDITLDKTILCNTSNEALEYISQSDVDIVITRLQSDNRSCDEFIKTLKEKLLFSIILGYGASIDFNCLCSAVNNGVSKYLEDVFDREKLEKLFKEAYEKHCTSKLSLMQIANASKDKQGISYSVKVLNEWVNGFARNASEGNKKNIDKYIKILTKIMDEQKLYHSKSMMLELIIIINDKINKGEIKSDYKMLSSNECCRLMHVDTAEELKNTLEHYMNGMAENIHLLSSADNQKSLWIIAATKFIKENFHMDISRDDVASEVNLNPSYFSKLFKEQMGESFVSYLRRIRIEKAISHLENTDDSVKEISSKVGYIDSNYFSRLFYKHTGYTPCEYRKGAVKLMA